MSELDKLPIVQKLRSAFLARRTEDFEKYLWELEALLNQQNAVVSFYKQLQEDGII